MGEKQSCSVLIRIQRHSLTGTKLVVFARLERPSGSGRQPLLGRSRFSMGRRTGSSVSDGTCALARWKLTPWAPRTVQPFFRGEATLGPRLSRHATTKKTGSSYIWGTTYYFLFHSKYQG